MEEAKFRVSGANTGPPICDTCRLKHPPLIKSRFQIEEEQEQLEAK